VSALQLDPVYNDLQFVGGNLVLVPTNSAQEFAQELNSRFGFGKGEWALDLNQGFPWLQAVMVKNPDLKVLAQLFKQTILATPGAKAVISLPIAFNAANRLLTWSAVIQHVSTAYVVGGYGQPFIVQQVNQ
jgi:hypothetical protein